MSRNRSSILVLILIIVIFVIVATVPILSPPRELLENRASGRLESGYYLAIPKTIHSGTVRFTFQTSRVVDAYIMSEEQHAQFKMSGIPNCEDVEFNAKIGLLTLKITESNKYYFTLYNKGTSAASITKLKIERIPPKATILQSILPS